MSKSGQPDQFQKYAATIQGQISMCRFVICLGLVGAALLAWLKLARWLPNGSERFFLLAPLVVGLSFLLVVPDALKQTRQRLRFFAIYLCGLIVVCALYAFFLSTLMAPIPTSIWNRVNFWEVGVAVYFLIALQCVFLPLLLGLRGPMRKLSDRLFGVAQAAALPSSTKRPLRHTLVEAALVPLLLPSLLAILNVHRFKIPNAATPRQLADRAYDDVSFTTSDGLTIRGWFVPAISPSPRTLLICHGLGVNRTNFFPFTILGDAIQANVLLFDFRGHGDSDGHTVSFGFHEKKDVLAAVGYLRRERPEQARELVGWGQSMGAAALLLGAADAEPPFDALIFDSSFAAAVDLADKLVQFLPAPLRPLLIAPGVPLASLHCGCDLAAIRPVDAIDRVRAPVLIIHAQIDPLIPSEHAQRLYERAVEPKTLWITETEGHGSAIREGSKYREAAQRLVEHRQPAGRRAD
jgi:fermentation-respiration switch protein FrsA (DUF1100 family)